MRHSEIMSDMSWHRPPYEIQLTSCVKMRIKQKKKCKRRADNDVDSAGSCGCGRYAAAGRELLTSSESRVHDAAT